MSIFKRGNQERQDILVLMIISFLIGMFFVIIKVLIHFRKYKLFCFQVKFW